MNKTALCVALALLVALPAAAHGPPPPRDYETRVLADDNDDCGGDGGSSVGGNCRGTHDLVALNIREAYDDAIGHALVITLVADKGDTGATLTDTVSFTAAGTAKSVVFQTQDDETFSVAGATRVVGPRPLLGADGQPDGSRFTVDAWFKRGDLGLSVGDRLDDFTVEARRGDTRGDVMPRGYVTALGTTTDGDQSTRYIIAHVDLKGPTQYLRITPQASITVEQGQTAFANIEVTNRLRDMAQTVTYKTEGTTHVEAGFHVIGSSSGEYPATMDDAIAKGASESIHLALTGTSTGSGTVPVTLTTDLGGLATAQVAYEVVPAGTTTSPTDDPSTRTSGEGQDSPGVGLLVLVALAVALAVRRR